MIRTVCLLAALTILGACAAPRPEPQLTPADCAIPAPDGGETDGGYGGTGNAPDECPPTQL